MPCLCFCCAPPGAQFGATAKLCLPPSFSTRGFLHKCLWVGIVVKAVRADHHIKGPRLKGQMLAVPHQKAGIGQVLGLRRLDHAQGQINSGAVFVRESPQQQLDHRAGSAANIQQRLKRILVQFFQNGRVIVLAHLIQSHMAGIIDFCRFGEFPDGHGLVFLFAHAEWAWVPHGDTCPFCIMLASNGWQKASAKLLKGGHASHIHANCDCEFAVRFDGNTGVAGYDPEKYLRQYRAAGSDVNAMRRIDYAAHRERINAQKRAAYAIKNALPQIPNFNPLSESKVVAVLRKEAQPWIESLSAAERIAFEKYTFNPGDKKPNRFYERLNWMLRGDAEEDSVLRGYAEKISGALKRSTLKHDVICYRTVTENPFPHNVAGDIVEPEQFFSTSVVKAGALKKGNYNIIIYAKAGTFAGYVEGLSEFKKQRELLLDKDSLYRVLSTKGNQILLEVI